MLQRECPVISRLGRLSFAGSKTSAMRLLHRLSAPWLAREWPGSVILEVKE
jgi:hypothetical protein